MSIEYGHFYVAEWVEEPGFRTGHPVIVAPGQFTIVSRVQAHLIEVTLQLARRSLCWEQGGSCSAVPLTGPCATG
ncbi:hypothetical protein [Streptomyces sp. PSKA30]|uniref:hypothetical protein n=1 Tax=Streptomyces sp. PSKA30 TaxID=2874597 RepID=UPI001CD14FB4|nr:hypothetical protein [Streptomyces sp. PSKA30]MBZ9644306.1 hypothetical protein [Streptomyces sp. PSKA30]